MVVVAEHCPDKFKWEYMHEPKQKEGDHGMKKLLSNENPFILANTKELLAQSGIDCSIRNEFIGGASGELPHFELWPEIWVLQDEDLERAQAIVEEISDNSRIEEWTCNFCQENNADSFEYCWNCRKERPASQL